MSNQKYYVKSKFWNGGQNYFTLDKSIITDSFWSRWINPKNFKAPQQQFTKAELSEIMDGAFYHLINEEWECGGGFYEPREWINPLIKLVPVEEVA